MKPFWRNIAKNISIDGTSVVAIMIIIVVAITITGFYADKEITIIDNQNITKVTTNVKTVGDLLKQANITLGEYDTIDYTVETKIRNLPTATICILRATPVTVRVDGNEQLVMTTKSTIKEALKDINIVLNELDYIDGHNIDDGVQEGMYIPIVRVVEELETKVLEVPFNQKTRKNSSLDKSVVKVVQNGINGERQITYKTTYENGVEVKKDIVKDILTKAPIDKITEIGTAGTKQLSRGGALRYKNVLNMKATAYTSCYEDTGKRPGHKDYGITASGRKAQRGVIAVDPKVIPLGTRVYVETVGKGPDYGYAIAADTGGAIKGNIIDLYYDTRAEALNWGRRDVKVYIID